MYFIVAACAVGLIGLMNQAVVAKQLDDWGVLPQPQRLSEFYFDPATHLPTSVKPGAKQRLSFTVHNIEHRTTHYRYELTAVSAEGDTVWSLGKGAFTLNHEQSQDVTRILSLPLVGDRMAIRVDLEYEVVKPGGSLGTQKQSIHHWVQMKDFNNNE